MNSNIATPNPLDAVTGNKRTDESSASVPSAHTPQSSFSFEAMNLKVGDRLQAQVPAKVSTERCTMRLIGYVQGNSILVTAPTTASGTRVQLIEGDPLVVRIFSSQNAFAFRSDIERVCKLPYNYLHLSFPNQIQGTVIRKSVRVRAKITASVFADGDGNAELAGVISNLSANGAMLEGPRSTAEVGDVLRLSFKMKLHSMETTLSLRGVVRAVIEVPAQKQSSTSLAHFGLEFVDKQPNDHMLLQSMVYQNMIEQPQSLL